MNSYDWLRCCSIILVVLLLSGCGAPKNASIEGNKSQPSLMSNSVETPVQQPIQDTVADGKRNPLVDPGQVREFLGVKNIPHGDIFLQDNVLYINIVELNEEIESLIAAAYIAGSYKTVNVAFTLKELETVQQKLSDHELHAKLGLYSSGIDVIGNKVTISMPDTIEAKAKLEIEKLVDPDMISYDIQLLNEKPDVVGTIVKLEQNRILILEDGEEEPGYYFSFSKYSEMLNEDGGEITFTDLQEKQKVRLWFAGAVMTSLPAHATARRLELVSN